jgi:hypothetical protein
VSYVSRRMVAVHSQGRTNSMPRSNPPNHMLLVDCNVQHSPYGTLKSMSSSEECPNRNPYPSKRSVTATTTLCATLFSQLRIRLFVYCPPSTTPNGDKSQFEKELDRGNHATTLSWKIAFFLSVAFAVIAAFRFKPVYEYYENRTPEWTWDRNVYIPRISSDTTSNENSESGEARATSSSRIALIAQVTEGLAMKHFSDVSARPNRAYARQWKVDYMQYYAGRVSYSPRSCFDKAFVLTTLAEKQTEEAKDPPSLWPHPSRVQYDVVLLLPSDAIVMDMDGDFIDALLPKEKLVAIAGWTNSREKFASISGVVLFNLRHRLAMKVIDLWWTMSQDTCKSCGSDNGISTLIDAIATAMDQRNGETLDLLIEGIPEYSNGTLGDRIIKCLPSSVPGARSEIFLNNMQQSGEIIHQTADSVCYRFYPKCEVVP